MNNQPLDEHIKVAELQSQLKVKKRAADFRSLSSMSEASSKNFGRLPSFSAQSAFQLKLKEKWKIQGGVVHLERKQPIKLPFIFDEIFTGVR